jgi:hypothetical protein
MMRRATRRRALQVAAGVAAALGAANAVQATVGRADGTVYLWCAPRRIHALAPVVLAMLAEWFPTASFQVFQRIAWEVV